MPDSPPPVAVLPATAGDQGPTALIDALPDPVIVVDGRGTIRWGNQRAERLFAMTLADSIGLDGLERVHPDDLELVLRSLGSIQAKEVGTPIEVRLHTAAGWRLMELVGAPVSGFGDDAVILSLRDLTERRQYELVHDHDSRLRSLVQNSAAITMLVSPDGCIESVSGALTRLLGQDPEMVEGRPLAELVATEDHPALAEAFERASRGATVAGPVNVTVSLLRHGNTGSLPFELAFVNLVDDPTVGGYVVTGHDITERRAADAELQKALWMLTATLDATADGIMVVDNDGRIVSFNRRLTEMWNVPESLPAMRDRHSLARFVSSQLVNPDSYLASVEEVYEGGPTESHDVLEFTDGRVFERVSKPQVIEGEVIGRVWSFRDVTDRKQLEERLSYQAFHDALTGLANRTLFQDRLHHAVARIDRYGGQLAVLFLDLDNLKVVNDSLGHTAGDTALAATAQTITGCLREADTAARLGGDEFGVLLEEIRGRTDALAVADRLMEALRRTVEIAGRQVTTTASMGITFHSPGTTGDQLLSYADLAMYAAKERGGNQYSEYAVGMLEAALTQA
jgi:diguanylate cyclase (GGDEF)-like protein/PAS domain S-box-containing protein